MPTYEYFCTKCEHSFEAVQSMKDAHFETCPEAHCQITPWGHGCVKRQLGTGAGLIFKGSGFYITDYRSENYKAGAKKEAPTGSTPGTAASGESKPAEGTKPKGDAPAAAPKTEAAKPATPPPKPPST